LMSIFYPNYTETKNDQTVQFESKDKQFILEGSLKQVDDYKVITMNVNSIEIKSYLLSAILAKEGGVWQSVFENEVEFGKLDTILDLNNDNVPEIILQKYERNKIGYESKLVIYAKKDAQKYLAIGEIAPNYYRGSDNKKATSTVKLLQVEDYKKLYVNILETDSVTNNKDNQKRVSSFYLVTTLGELNQEFADQLILSSEPLAFKVSQDNFWGIYCKVGDEVLSKPVKLMDGFADILTSSGETRQILPTEYTEILPSSEGLIPVKNKDGSWGFVNLKGEFAVECKYTGVSKFDRGKAVVLISGEDDWRKAYRYIDNKGKELGLFFDKISGKECIDLRLTISSELGERLSEHELSNCPNGVMSVNYQGWEWSSGKTFYPNVSIEQLIVQLANTNDEFANIYKKFNGNATEYNDGDYTISITIEKDNDGKITSVNFNRDSDYEGSSRKFDRKETGVMISKSHGS